MGLNAAQRFACEDNSFWRYGRAGDQADDQAALGVSTVRQLGTRDLVWTFLPDLEAARQLSAERTVYRDEPLITTSTRGGLTVYSVLIPVDPSLNEPGAGHRSTLERLIVSERNVARFATELQELRRRGQKVVLTLLVLGGGNPPASTDAGPIRLEVTEGGADYTVRDFAALSWHPEHIGQSLGKGESSFAERWPDVEAEREKALFTFDPGDAYQRAYAAAIASHAVKLLVRAMERLRDDKPTLVLGDIVAGIEIFNEVGIRGWYQRSRDERAVVGPAGRDWGRAWFEVAQAMWSAFTEEGAEADRVDLHLPGMEEWFYQENEYYPRTWSYKKDFLRALLDEVQVGLRGWEKGPTLQELVRGVDLHWYRREVPGTPYPPDADPSKPGVPFKLAGYVHIGYLYMELQELRALLDDEYQLTEASITVFETGMSTMLVHPQYEDDTGGTAMAEKEVVSEFIPTDFTDQETRWQGLEIWRRLGTTLASVADLAGVHCWSSGSSGPYVGMGLRQDAYEVHGEEGDWSPLPLTAPARLSTRRDSWYTYQRLAHRLGTRTLTSRMVLPEVGSRDALTAFIASGVHLEHPGHSVVVLEFHERYRVLGTSLAPPLKIQGPGEWGLVDRYYYLVFVEPIYLQYNTAVTTPVSGSVRLLYRSATATGVVELALIGTMPHLPAPTPIKPNKADVGYPEGRGRCQPLPGGDAHPPAGPFTRDRSHNFWGATWQGMSFDTRTLDGLAPRLIVSTHALMWRVP